MTANPTRVRVADAAHRRWTMPRALRAFRDAAFVKEAKWELIPAPMGLAPRVERPALRWLPSAEGTFLVRAVLREKLGLWLGA